MCQPVVKKYPEDTAISFFAGLKEARVDVGKKWRISCSRLPFLRGRQLGAVCMYSRFGLGEARDTA